MTFFTDGSVQEGLAGAGVHSAEAEVDLSFRLGPSVTIFQAEVFAISACANVCLQSGIRNRRILICIDSQAALRALSSFCIDSKLVFECVTQLNKLARANELTLVWVPGHSGVSGNEKVDELARVGSSEPATGADPFLPLTRSWIVTSIREWARKSHALSWLRLSTCRQAKSFLPLPLSPSKVSFIRSLARTKLRLLAL